MNFSVIVLEVSGRRWSVKRPENNSHDLIWIIPAEEEGNYGDSGKAGVFFYEGVLTVE